MVIIRCFDELKSSNFLELIIESFKPIMVAKLIKEEYIFINS
jgi:hypothetical protein